VILVDTDVLIDVLEDCAPKGVRDAAKRGNLSTTAIAAYEVRRGARTDEARDSVETLLKQMSAIEPFDDPAATQVPLTPPSGGSRASPQACLPAAVLTVWQSHPL